MTPVKCDPQIKKKERSKNAQIAIEVSKIKKKANARTILNSYYEECYMVENSAPGPLKRLRGIEYKGPLNGHRLGLLSFMMELKSSDYQI